jgi:hypothetical protein
MVAFALAAIAAAVDCSRHGDAAWDAVRWSRGVMVTLLLLCLVLWVLFPAPIFYWLYLAPRMRRFERRRSVI